MKRISYLIAAAAMFVFSMAAYAQESAQTQYNSSEELYEMMDAPKQLYKGDFFVGIGGGANVYFGEHDRVMMFKHRLAPSMDVYLGKWLSPVWGVRFRYSGGRAFGLTNSDTKLMFSTGNVYPYRIVGNKGLHWQEFDYFSVHADAMLNVVNWIWGENPDRVFHASPYVGVGVAKQYGTPDATKVALSIGLYNTVRLADSWNLVLDIHGIAVPEGFEHETGVRPGKNPKGLYSFDGILTAALGVSYSF